MSYLWSLDMDQVSKDTEGKCQGSVESWNAQPSPAGSVKIITGAWVMVILQDNFIAGIISVMLWYFMMKLLTDGLQAEKLGLVFFISRDLPFLE